MTKTQFKHLENWLELLIISYQIQPDTCIIKHIIYYIDRLTQYIDDKNQLNMCQYAAMKRYWQWKLDNTPA